MWLYIKVCQCVCVHRQLSTIFQYSHRYRYKLHTHTAAINAVQLLGFISLPFRSSLFFSFHFFPLPPLSYRSWSFYFVFAKH